MIPTGKTRLAYVDILTGPRAKRFRGERFLNFAVTLRPGTGNLYLIVCRKEAMYCRQIKKKALSCYRCVVWIDRSASSVSCFHSCRLGPRSTRDLIIQLPTALVCCALRFLSLLLNVFFLGYVYEFLNQSFHYF